MKLQRTSAAIRGLRRLCSHWVNVNDGFVVLAETNNVRIRPHDGFELREHFAVGLGDAQFAHERLARDDFGFVEDDFVFQTLDFILHLHCAVGQRPALRGRGDVGHGVFLRVGG